MQIICFFICRGKLGLEKFITDPKKLEDRNGICMNGLGWANTSKGVGSNQCRIALS